MMSGLQHVSRMDGWMEPIECRVKVYFAKEGTGWCCCQQEGKREYTSRAIDMLLLIENNRENHAVLFSGERGVRGGLGLLIIVTGYRCDFPYREGS